MMKKLLPTIAAAVLLATAFYGGTVFGIHQGVTLGQWADALLRAETARRNLVWIEKGDTAALKGLQESELQESLLKHYNLMHYDYPFLVPNSARTMFKPSSRDGTPFDQVFMGRIIGYAKDHPGALNPSVNYDLEKLPESTDEERQWKKIQAEGLNEWTQDLIWLVEHYQQTPVPARGLGRPP